MAEEQENPAQKLVRALNELEDEDRNEVLAWLFDRIPQSTIPTATALRTDPTLSHMSHRWRQYREAEAALFSGWGDLGRQDLKMVPVRMPVEQHAQLQEWCKEHNFSMATVIRGLLARFLDEQSQPPGEATAG
jgi:hypothetical protein